MPEQQILWSSTTHLPGAKWRLYLEVDNVDICKWSCVTMGLPPENASPLCMVQYRLGVCVLCHSKYHPVSNAPWQSSESFLSLFSSQIPLTSTCWSETFNYLSNQPANQIILFVCKKNVNLTCRDVELFYLKVEELQKVSHKTDKLIG